MDAKHAVREFANLVRVGSHALQGVLAEKEASRARELAPTINELLFMLERFEELADELEGLEVDRAAPRKRA